MAQFGIQNCPLELATESRGHRQGDKGTRGRGQGKREIALLFSSSLFPLVSPSPCPLVFLSVWLCGRNTVTKFRVHLPQHESSQTRWTYRKMFVNCAAPDPTPSSKQTNDRTTE